MEENNIGFSGKYTVECSDKNGDLKWTEIFDNTVVNEGLQHILDTEFSAGSAVSPWYVGLTDGTPTVNAADTLASHAGWVEIVPTTDYTGNRKEYVEVRTGQVLSNSVSKAEFAILQTITIGGAFICSVDTGTSGVLMSAAAFTNGDKNCDNGDTISVQYDLTAATA